MSGLELIDTQMYKEISPEVRSLIKQIKSSCRDGVDILDDFLAYEKMDGELTVIEKTELLVSDLVKQCLSPFTLQAKLKSTFLVQFYYLSYSTFKMFLCCLPFSYVDIRLQYSETDYTDPCGKAFLPIIKIEVDNFKIRQVLRNLISNAVKFTPSGGTITCNVKLKDESVDPDIVCDKGIVRIEIIDTGVGLSPENQSKLFKEIIQFDAKTLQGGGGSGLGLWLTKGLVALNGGTVGVFSEGTGKGTTFYVEFPVSEVKFSQLGEKNRVYSSFELADTTTNSTHNLDLKQRGVDGWKDLRLLVVDDSMMSRKMVVRLLSPKFRDVVEVADGQEAVDQVIHAIEINTPFDVVLMDSQMPRMSGLEAAKELRRLGFTGAIMGLTGNGGTEDVREFMDQVRSILLYI